MLAFSCLCPWEGPEAAPPPPACQFGCEPEILFHYSHLAEIQGLLCPQGQRVGWKRGTGSLSPGRGFPAQTVVRTRPALY